MLIGGLQRCSLIDYPGEICSIVFTYGCNFRCPYCHNPELVTGSPPLLDLTELFGFLHNRTRKLTAVSITGGEPTLHKDLPELIKRIKEMGFKVKLDTNGTNPRMLETLIIEGLLDYIAMDVKAPFSKYQMVSGKQLDLSAIRDSISIIKNSRIGYEFRTTLVKELLNPDDIEEIAEEIAPAKIYALQRFIPSKTLDKSLMNAHSFSEQEIESLKEKLKEMFDRVVIR